MDSWINIMSALTLGFIGSLHCVGMCGPIALALPLGKRKLAQKFLGVSYYNVGRIITYSLLGTLFGIIGLGFSLAGLQQSISISIGIIMLLSVFFNISSISSKLNIGLPIISSIKTKLTRLFGNTSLTNLFLIGILNGLLPCGLVYVAVFGAILSESIINAMLYMIAFGLGTFPLMFITSMAGNWASASLRKTFNKILPIIIVIIAILFILRGLNLEIPYLSPPSEVLSPTPTEKKCH